MFFYYTETPLHCLSSVFFVLFFRMEKQKIDYNRLMENQIAQFSNDSNTNKPTLLLHACCAPCSSAVLERLSNFFDFILFFEILTIK